MTKLVNLSRRPTTKPRRRTKNILLISPSYSDARNAMYFPIGLAYLSGYVRQFGHHVVALNMNHLDAKARYAELDRILREEDINIVGVGGLTIAFEEIAKIVEFTRARSKAPVVIGGGVSSCESELVMSTIRPEYMVIGEGEVIFQQLLDAIEYDTPMANVGGIYYWDGDTPISTGEGQTVANLDELPDPDYELFGIEEHLGIQGLAQWSYHESRVRVQKAIPITASRSCPFRCTFCYHAGMGTYKRHSIVSVVEQIEKIHRQYRAAHVSIYDELFSANKDRIYEFCRLLKEKELELTWYCQLRVDQLDQDLLHTMRDAGCIHISFGFESGSDTVLKSMRKKISAQQIARAVEMTRNARIAIQANFLFGDPAETMDTLQESLEFQQTNELYFCDWSAVIPYPGTQVYQYALDKGLIKDRVEFMRNMRDVSRYLWNHMINMTDLSDEEYHEWYVKLRELNDQNHRKRPAKVLEGSVHSPTYSKMTIECPSCGRVEEDLLVPYPAGPVNLDSVIGVPGFNIVCQECQRKMHLQANRIPHVRRTYERFDATMARLAEQRTEVVVLPAMDRYFGTFRQDIEIDQLNVKGVLDSRERRIGELFLGSPVERLTHENARAHQGRTFVIFPWVEYRRAIAILLEGGVSPDQIVSWNEHFGQDMLPPTEHKTQPASLTG